MKRYAIYTDARGGAGGTVNRASFDGTYVWNDVAMRSDTHARMLASAVRILKRDTAARGVHLANGLYIERHEGE